MYMYLYTHIKSLSLFYYSREDYDDANSQYLLEYKEELAEWKIYEKKRVSENLYYIYIVCVHVHDVFISCLTN